MSEGLGRGWLEQHRTPADRLTLLDYQPEDRLPEVLASADVFILVLGHDASRYSLPSKLYTYACAGRPVLAVVPRDSEVARLVEEIGCGLVVDVDDPAGLATAARTLAEDGELRRGLGAAGRAWAVRTMDPDLIAARFNELISRVTSAARPPTDHFDPRTERILDMPLAQLDLELLRCPVTGDAVTDVAPPRSQELGLGELEAAFRRALDPHDEGVRWIGTPRGFATRCSAVSRCCPGSTRTPRKGRCPVFRPPSPRTS